MQTPPIGTLRVRGRAHGRDWGDVSCMHCIACMQLVVAVAVAGVALLWAWFLTVWRVDFCESVDVPSHSGTHAVECEL